MVSTLEKSKRAAIAEKLADMRAIQNLIITNEQEFLSESSEAEIRDRIEDMLEDDQKNLEILETVITEFGIQSKPKQTVQKMVEHIQSMMKGSELNLYEKMAQHELIKHGQVVSGLIVHKAAQVSEADVKEALAAINTVNFDNRAHQEQLKGMLEILGTRQLTGKEPEQGLWGRVQDAISATTGIFGSATSRVKDELNILELIRTDHNKVKTMLGEIESSENSDQVREVFAQLYVDLITHEKSENEIVYPKIRNFYDKTQDLYNEHDQIEERLNVLKSMNPVDSDFKPTVVSLRKLIKHHIRQEERDLFPKMRKNMSTEELNQMGTEFKEMKKQRQMSMSS